MDSKFTHASNDPNYKKSVTKISVFSMLLSLFCAALIVVVGAWFYYNQVVVSLSESATVLALQTANMVDTEQLELILFYDCDEAWQQMQTMFDIILYASVDFLYLYIIVPYDEERFMYVVSGNHAYLRHFVDDPEVYSEEAAWTTLRYGHITTTAPDYYGVWGQMLSAFVPLRDQNDNIIAVLGADIDISVIRSQVVELVLVLGFMCVLILLVLSYILRLYISSILKTFTKKLIESEQERLLSVKKSETKTRFLAKMSHEIRTPMNVILGLTELQLQKKKLPKSIKDIFLQIYGSSKLLLNIINDILDYSKVELGKMEIVQKPYDLRGVIAANLQLNLIYIGEKNIKFELHIKDNQFIHLVGDKLRIQQVLNNLLSNAFKYTKEGSVSLKVDFSEEPETNEVLLELAVSDTGCGMSEEQLGLLFTNDYVRFAPQCDSTVEGSGLGLSIAYQIAKLLGGSLEAKSQPGQGSVFTFTLKQEKHSDELLGSYNANKLRRLDFKTDAIESVTTVNYQSLSHGSVLVVDDIQSNIVVIREMLSMYELKVDTVQSGAEAIKLVTLNMEYDMIFMDYMMPELDGIETMHKLREIGYQKPIIVLTADITNNNEQVFISKGFDGFLSKPINVHDLDMCLLHYIPEVNQAPKPKRRYSKRLLESFVSDANKGLSSLSNLLVEIDERGNFDRFRIAVHGLKSACGNVGLHELSDFAKRLEKAASDENVEKIKAQTPQFLSLLDNALKSPEFQVI